MNGIIHYLQNTTGEIYLNRINVVGVSCKSPTKWFVPENIFTNVSDRNNGFYASSGNNDEWFQYDFYENGVYVTHYAIEAYAPDFLYFCEVLCSLDNKNWFQIAHYSFNQLPSSNLDTKIILPFPVQNPRVCRYFRIQQRTKRFHGDSLFALHRLELFGKFYNHSSLLHVIGTKHCQICRFFVLLFPTSTINICH